MKKIIQYSGTEIYYRTKKTPGSRATILFLHGWGCSGSIFASTEPFWGKLYDCIVISFPMFQLTDKNPPQNAYTLSDYANITQQILETECGIRCGTNSGTVSVTAANTDTDAAERLNPNVFVLAHSFGARLAVKLAARCPNMFKKLLLTGAAGIPKRRSLGIRVKILFYKFMRSLGLSTKNKGSADYRALTSAGKGTFQNILKEDLRPQIAAVTLPTLLIFGKQDSATPPAMGKQWTKICKTSRLLIYQHTGHFCFLESPSRFIIDAQTFFEES